MTQPHSDLQSDSQSDGSTLRAIDLVRIGEGRYKALNGRGGLVPIGPGDDPDFSPVELLLAAIAGCSAIDAESITGKRAPTLGFDVRAEGHKVRDEHGSRMVDLRVSFDLTFPEGEDGDKAREVLPRALAMVRDRLCTVARTVQVGAEVTYPEAEPAAEAEVDCSTD